MLSVVAGFFSGIISGMGIGGGTILIPALVFFLKVNQHTAQCTNLYYFIPTAVCALVIHIINKKIEYKTALKITFYGIFGALLGSYVASALSTDVLRKIFAVFLFIMGISQVIPKKSKTQNKN